MKKIWPWQDKNGEVINIKEIKTLTSKMKEKKEENNIEIWMLNDQYCHNIHAIYIHVYIYNV